MVEVVVNVEGEQKHFGMDKWLYYNLADVVKPKVQKRDFDYLFIVDGEEGSGKSVFAMQLAKVLDPNFSLDKIAFTADEFTKCVVSAKAHSCIIFDEAFTGLSSRASLSEINKLLVELMMEMRQRNLFVIIVMPTFFMLERYVVLHRSKCLFHVYINKKDQRGQWLWFDRNSSKILYDKGKKFYNYHSVSYKKWGRFPNFYTVSEEEYRKKKRSQLVQKKRKTKADRFKSQRDILFFVMHHYMKYSQTDIMRNIKKCDFTIAPGTLSEILSNMRNQYIKSED